MPVQAVFERSALIAQTLCRDGPRPGLCKLRPVGTGERHDIR
jgi:hypothetical protein